jgi:hypothetical protein
MKLDYVLKSKPDTRSGCFHRRKRLQAVYNTHQGYCLEVGCDMASALRLVDTTGLSTDALLLLEFCLY